MGGIGWMSRRRGGLGRGFSGSGLGEMGWCGWMCRRWGKGRGFSLLMRIGGRGSRLTRLEDGYASGLSRGRRTLQLLFWLGR